MSPETAHVLLVAIVAVSILLMLLRPRNIAEVWWISSGALLLVLLRLISPQNAGKAVAQGADVYLFLIGMMLLSEISSEQGVFDWLSNQAILRSRKHSARLFTLIYGIGTLVTICLSNDATAVVLTPAVLSAVRKAKVEPRPHLFACAMIANAASFVLPISNPANLVVFHTGMPPLPRWLAAFTLPSLLSIATTYVVLRTFFRKELATTLDCEVEHTPLPPGGKLVLGGLGLVVIVLLTASSLNLDLGLPTCLCALAISALVCLRAHTDPLPLLRRISWPTLLLVAGLFVMVRAVESLGTLRLTQAALSWAQHLAPLTATMLTGFSVAIVNNIVNNLPLGLIAGATVQAAHVRGLLANAVLIGVDLGPNLSVTGSLATILWLLAIRKENLNISAWDFLKVGLLAMPIAMVPSLAALFAMQHTTGQ